MTKDNGFLEGNGIIILILFFLIFGFGGGGWGNSTNSSALTRAELYDGLNTQDIQNSLNNLGTSINNGFNGVQIGMNSGFAGVQSAIADSNYRMADCCCQIKTAIHDEGEQTRALLQNNTIQELRDSLQDAKNENLVTGLVTAQTIQTNNLENFIRSIVNGCGCN